LTKFIILKIEKGFYDIVFHKMFTGVEKKILTADLITARIDESKCEFVQSECEKKYYIKFNGRYHYWFQLNEAQLTNMRTVFYEIDRDDLRELIDNKVFMKTVSAFIDKFGKDCYVKYFTVATIHFDKEKNKVYYLKRFNTYSVYASLDFNICVHFITEVQDENTLRVTNDISGKNVKNTKFTFGCCELLELYLKSTNIKIQNTIHNISYLDNIYTFHFVDGSTQLFKVINNTLQEYNGNSANGTSANGTSANGTSANGTSANGTSANGTSDATVDDIKKYLLDCIAQKKYTIDIPNHLNNPITQKWLKELCTAKNYTYTSNTITI